MLNKPSMNQLMKNVDSKYTLVIVAAKRARAVIDRNPDFSCESGVSPVSMALNDVADGRLTWKDPVAQEAAPAAQEEEKSLIEDSLDLLEEPETID